MKFNFLSHISSPNLAAWGQSFRKMFRSKIMKCWQFLKRLVPWIWTEEFRSWTEDFRSPPVLFFFLAPRFLRSFSFLRSPSTVSPSPSTDSTTTSTSSSSSTSKASTASSSTSLASNDSSRSPTSIISASFSSLLRSASAVSVVDGVEFEGVEVGEVDGPNCSSNRTTGSIPSWANLKYLHDTGFQRKNIMGRDHFC